MGYYEPASRDFGKDFETYIPFPKSLKNKTEYKLAGYRVFDKKYLNQIYLTLKKAVLEMDNPILMRFDLYFNKGFFPQDNKEITSLMKKISDKFSRTPVKQGKGRKPYKTFTPILVWVREQSDLSENKISPDNTPITKIHYHCFIIVEGITKYDLVLGIIDKLWINLLTQYEKKGFLFKCNKYTGFHKEESIFLTDRNSYKLKLDNEFEKAFLRCSYLAKKDTKLKDGVTNCRFPRGLSLVLNKLQDENIA